ncbi:hypothetical protein SLA2020_268220 [Shorea laevis]
MEVEECEGGVRVARVEARGRRDGYDFGTCYEVECESDDPERVKRLIERLLEENGIGFSNSETSKFAIFRSGKLPS